MLPATGTPQSNGGHWTKPGGENRGGILETPRPRAVRNVRSTSPARGRAGEMQQRLVDAGAVVLRRDVTAGGLHSLLHFGNRVSGTGGITGKPAVEHPNVVLVVSGSEKLVAGNV